MKTIAQQLNITDFPFEIKDKEGRVIYLEDSDNFWSKREYDSHGYLTCYEDSDGYSSKREYDSQGNQVYYENSEGEIIDRRPKETSRPMNTPTKLLSQHLDEIAEYLDSEEEIAISFTKYFKKSIGLFEMYEKHIAMDAYYEGANVGREMMKAWMQGKESDTNSYDEFQKYWWAENNNKKEANG